MKNETLEDLLINETKIIFKYLIKIGAKKEDAEDIVQDTICKMIENIDAIDEEKVISWMFKVSINRYFNLYNKNKRINKYVCVTDDNAFRGIIENNLTERYILAEEYRDYVNKTLNIIKPSYKELLVLKYFMELSYRDISILLDFSEDKVKTYLYRARNKFREIWEELNYER